MYKIVDKNNNTILETDYIYDISKFYDYNNKYGIEGYYIKSIYYIDIINEFVKYMENTNSYDISFKQYLELLTNDTVSDEQINKLIKNEIVIVEGTNEKTFENKYMLCKNNYNDLVNAIKYISQDLFKNYVLVID